MQPEGRSFAGCHGADKTATDERGCGQGVHGHGMLASWRDHMGCRRAETTRTSYRFRVSQAPKPFQTRVDRLCGGFQLQGVKNTLLYHFKKTPCAQGVTKIKISHTQQNIEASAIRPPTTKDAQSMLSTYVFCRATLNEIDQSIPASTRTKVLYPATDFNVGNGFDTSNSRFIPSFSGYYRVTAQGWLQSTSDARFLQFYFFKNGADVSAQLAHASTGTWLSAGISDIIHFNGTTDYLEVFVYHNNPLATPLKGYSSRTFFTAELIG